MILQWLNGYSMNPEPITHQHSKGPKHPNHHHRHKPNTLGAWVPQTPGIEWGSNGYETGSVWGGQLCLSGSSKAGLCQLCQEGSGG